MNLSRRGFLKTSALAFLATQLPIPEGHRVLFIDGSAHLVTNYTTSNGTIKAKAVNGAWDLILDTKNKIRYAYCNTSYGIDNDNHGKLMDSSSYKELFEVYVPIHLGSVSEDLKPRTEIIRKYVEKGKPGSEWINNTHLIKDETIMVPSMIMAVSPFEHWVPEYMEIIIDPLNGAKVDYNRIIDWVITNKRS